jgi:hypothetical protein
MPKIVNNISKKKISIDEKTQGPKPKPPKKIKSPKMSPSKRKFENKIIELEKNNIDIESNIFSNSEFPYYFIKAHNHLFDECFIVFDKSENVIDRNSEIFQELKMSDDSVKRSSLLNGFYENNKDLCSGIVVSHDGSVSIVIRNEKLKPEVFTFEKNKNFNLLEGEVLPLYSYDEISYNYDFFNEQLKRSRQRIYKLKDELFVSNVNESRKSLEILEKEFNNFEKKYMNLSKLLSQNILLNENQIKKSEIIVLSRNFHYNNNLEFLFSIMVYMILLQKQFQLLI